MVEVTSLEVISSESRGWNSLGSARQPRTVVIETEQVDDGSHIVLAANAYADPPRVRKNVVTLRAARGDELFPNRNGKWQIGEPASMQMPELPSSHTKFKTAEPMRSGNHTVPRTDFAGDPGRK